MRNKYTLYILLTILMIYIAVGKLNIFAPGLAGLFAVIWLIFALVVFAGNLVGFLFAPRKKRTTKVTSTQTIRRRQRNSH